MGIACDQSVITSEGGEAAVLHKKGVSAVQSAPVLGEGAHRLLHVFLQEALGFKVLGKLHAQDYGQLALQERRRWRHAGLAAGLTEIQLPFALQMCNADNPRKRTWRAIPEAFGDILCESAQVLRVLLGKRQPREQPYRGWNAEGALIPEHGSRKRPLGIRGSWPGSPKRRRMTGKQRA